MSTSLVLGAVGAVVGSAFGMPQLGFIVGSTLGSLVDRPDGPSPGDLSAPQIQEGAPLPRPYGTVMLTVNFTSISDYTATANPTGGKGGPPEGSAGYTYTLDVLGTIAHRVPSMPLVAVTRVWVNKKLVETRLAASTSASLAASAATEAYTSLTLYPGGSSQNPPPEYETRVGTANASGYRNVATVEIIGLVCGGSKTPPLVEVECITAGTEAGALTLLQSRFIGASATDESYYARGAPTQSGGTVTANGFVVDNDNSAFPNALSSLDYQPTPFQTNGIDALTVECLATWTQTGATPGTPILRFTPNVLFPSEHHTFAWYFDTGGVSYENQGFGSEYSTATAAPPNCHFAIVSSATAASAYINGVRVWTGAPGILPTGTNMRVQIGDIFGTTSGRTTFTVHGFRVRQEEVYTGASFTPPTEIPPPDGAPWVPGTADLQDIVDAELAMNPAITLADHDTSDLAGVPVRGFKAVGPPGKTIAELGDIFYFDLVPGSPLRYQRRGAAVVGTIANVDTGVGVDEAGSPFTGLKIGNDIERPSVVGLSAPNASADHEPVFRRGDRLTTEGPDVEKRRTEVGLIPSEVQGRALAMSLMARASAHTAEFGLSDKYAALEPGDAYYVYDDQGNLYNLLFRSITYADGVHNAKTELNDTSALVETGITDADYTPSLIVEAPPVVEWLAMDLPLLRDVDNDAGYYAAVKPGLTKSANWMESRDDVLYSTVETFSQNATFGTVTAKSGSFPALNVFDEGSTITVDIGDGTLSSATRAELLADRSVNAFAVGDAGRWVVGQFRTATLVSAGVYTLSGLLLGEKGTEQYASSIAVTDDFVLLTTAGTGRIARSANQLGFAFYVKAVSTTAAAASVTGETFFNDGIALRPLQPVMVRASRDAAGDITLTWVRRTRLDTRFGGALGDSCPLGEETEQYQVRIYSSNTFATSLRSEIVTSASLTYTSAQQTTDFGGNQSTVHVSVAQISAVVGAGYQRRASV